MNCRDFERIWNDRIDRGGALAGDDARPGGFKENEQALVEHAAGCASCRGRAAGYEVLHQAILAWGNAPEPPVGLTERILAAASAPLPTARKWRMAASQRWLLAAAASILVVITAGVISRVVVDRCAERELLAGHAVRRAASTGDRATAIPKLDHALASADRRHLGPGAVGDRAGCKIQPPAPGRSD